VVDAVVAEGGVRRVAVDGLLEGLSEAGVLKSEVELESALRGGALRTLPGVHGCDGFFAVVLEK
jgi:16S rRNA (cytosine967-C5)-methyltransferase